MGQPCLCSSKSSFFSLLEIGRKKCKYFRRNQRPSQAARASLFAVGLVFAKTRGANSFIWVILANGKRVNKSISKSNRLRPPFQSQRLAGVLREFLTSRNLRREHWQGGTKRRALLFEPLS